MHMIQLFAELQPSDLQQRNSTALCSAPISSHRELNNFSLFTGHDMHTGARPGGKVLVITVKKLTNSACKVHHVAPTVQKMEHLSHLSQNFAKQEVFVSWFSIIDISCRKWFWLHPNEVSSFAIFS